MPPIVADPAADMPLFRSVSARDAPEANIYAAPCEKRRSTSFDETHGELAGAIATACSAEGPAVAKKKTGFWHSRVWKFTKGKKATKVALYAIPEKEEEPNNTTAPKWKRLLHKLRFKTKDVSRPAICSSSVDLHVSNLDRSGILRGDGRNKSIGNQAERQQQRPYSVYPEPAPICRRSVGAPIWERRRVGCPPTLDLNNLRVTGLRHLSRTHQAKG